MAVTRLHRSRFAPWAGLVAGMVAYAVDHQLLSDMLRYDCRLGGAAMGFAVGIPAMLLTLLGMWVSWASTQGGDTTQTQHQTRRFIAMLSLMMAATLAIGIVWQTFATMVVPACAP